MTDILAGATVFIHMRNYNRSDIIATTGPRHNDTHYKIIHTVGCISNTYVIYEDDIELVPANLLQLHPALLRDLYNRDPQTPSKTKQPSSPTAHPSTCSFSTALTLDQQASEVNTTSATGNHTPSTTPKATR